MEEALQLLNGQLEGELGWDEITRVAYATDASIYRELPAAVAFPRNEHDLVVLTRFATSAGTSLIPRTAGTSLAGQVVGSGIVVDLSRHMNRIIEINPSERYAWVEPGVVLDELNGQLAPYGLFFGPETSTSNRCMIGGMLGNNACGLHSLVYGSTRDHTLEVRAVLSDGSVANFGPMTWDQFESACSGDLLEHKIYHKVREILAFPENREEIRNGYPDPAIPRRNTGYALDLLIDTDPFTGNGVRFNMCKLLGGSEGTLTLFSAIKVGLVDLPPTHKALICSHFNNLREALEANLAALDHHPSAVEMMDYNVLDCTRTSHGFQANRFFLQGEPKFLLIIEMTAGTGELLDIRIKDTIDDLVSRNLGYAHPVVRGKDIKRVWDLRKAGLGLLANKPGDAKAVTVIEDAAVPVGKLADYITDMEELFSRHQVSCVYHAHVGTGELHLRPSLNLKDPADVDRFRDLAAESVRIIRKYRGSLSGEHGDGRLRANLIPELLGPVNYQFICEIKKVFDPGNIFNPGKIVNALPIDSHLRNEPGRETPLIPTMLDFSDTLGIVRAAEKCNGSGDCRKSHLMGGTMCPSYQATLDEKNTTRARANILREFLYREPGKNRFDHPEIFEILDLCLSCKACKSECPSGVDMAKLKAEFLFNWHQAHGIPIKSNLIANLPILLQLAYPFRFFFNRMISGKTTGKIIKWLAGIHKNRSIPGFTGISVKQWARHNLLNINASADISKGKVFIFLDEFTNFQDSEIGIKSILLLTKLGYSVIVPKHGFSGRTYISKGLLDKAKTIARRNVKTLSMLVGPGIPLIGIEPSAILGFRDEYPDLVGNELRPEAVRLSKSVYTLDEFLVLEIKSGRIDTSSFTNDSKEILLHGHCQQKAVGSTDDLKFILSFPENFTCREINSGCCGMAGAFGYEKEHYDLSMKVGELALFPAVRLAPETTILCAPGTSCRHHIKDGTGRRAFHPAEILFEAMV